MSGTGALTLRLDWWLRCCSALLWHWSGRDANEAPRKRVNQTCHREDEFTSDTRKSDFVRNPLHQFAIGAFYFALRQDELELAGTRQIHSKRLEERVGPKTQARPARTLIETSPQKRR
jgi:hypothetical protein